MAPTCFSLWPSSGSLQLSLAKVILILKHSVRLRRNLLCGGVAACPSMVCVLCAVQSEKELQLRCHLFAIHIYKIITTLKQLHFCAALNHIGLYKTWLHQKQFYELFIFREDCVFTTETQCWMEGKKLKRFSNGIHSYC
jgi:hypothetical protein